MEVPHREESRTDAEHWAALLGAALDAGRHGGRRSTRAGLVYTVSGLPPSLSSGGNGRSLRLRFRASVDSVPHARHRLIDWLLELDVPHAVIDDMALAITELVTNAVEASPNASAPVLVHATFDEPDLCIEVIDEGYGFALEDTATVRPSPQSLRGRGLPIVRALVDLVEVDRSDGRTRVVTTTRLTHHHV